VKNEELRAASPVCIFHFSLFGFRFRFNELLNHQKIKDLGFLFCAFAA
jgi:hypothetical protein